MMPEREPRLVAVGRFGRAVLDAGRKLGVLLPDHIVLAPGDPVPAAAWDGAFASDGSRGLAGGDPASDACGKVIVAIDPMVASGTGFWDSVRALAGSAPVIVLAIGHEDGDDASSKWREDGCLGSWICLGPRNGNAEVADAAALLAAGLRTGDVRLPEMGTSEFLRLELAPGRPRSDCARLLAARAAERLLADLPGTTDLTGRLASQSPAWAIMLGEGAAPAEDGQAFPALAEAMADPVAPVAAAFAAGRLKARELVPALRAAVAELPGERPTVPLTVLAGDLDRALGTLVARDGIGAGRALLTSLFKAAAILASSEEPVPWPEPDSGEPDIEEILADLDRRSRSISLAATFTKREALLSGLRDLADAIRRRAARRAQLPPRAPVIALLESRWRRLDSVEDALAELAAAATPALLARVRHEDYLGSLPDGEEAAIDALLAEPGLGPAMLSGDLPSFLSDRAAARFFGWVPDTAERAPIEEAPGRLREDGAGSVWAAIVGIPGSLPAGRALDLARKLGSGTGVEPLAVPIDAGDAALLVCIRKHERRGMAPVRTASGGVGIPGASELPGRLTRMGGAPAESHRPAFPVAAGSDDGFWAVFRGLVARARPGCDEPGQALAAAWREAPLQRMEVVCQERLEALLADQRAWLRLSRHAPRAIQPEAQANLEAAIAQAHLWEDGLCFWEDRAALVTASTDPMPAWIGRYRPATRLVHDDDVPAWQGAAAPEPLDPLAEVADLAAIGLATHLITHIDGYLGFTYAEENGLIHTALLAPADDPAGTIAGILANPEALPVLRREARARLDDSRFHDAIRAFAHDLAAEVATRDWLRMPVSPDQRLLADRGLVLMRRLPEGAGHPGGGAIAAPASDVPWDAGMVLPGLARGDAA